MSVLAIIPARSGSEGIPDKNIRPFCGVPLVVRAIKTAQAVEMVHRVIVSTDSEGCYALCVLDLTPQMAAKADSRLGVKLYQRGPLPKSEWLHSRASVWMLR